MRFAYKLLMCPIGSAALMGALSGCPSLKPGVDRADATANADPDSDAGATCDHREPPPPPDASAGALGSADAAGDGPDIVFAVFETEFGSQATDAGPPRYPTFGFDLDHTCTGHASCVEPSWVTPEGVHQGPDGIDNSYGEVVGVLAPETLEAAPFRTEFLLRVHGYRAQLDQDSLDVSLYLALGLSPREDGGVGPYWDGLDRWTVLPEVLAAPPDGGTASVDDALFHADRAYVTGGVLVAVFDKTLWLSGLANVPRLLVHARQFTVAGRLVPPDAGEGWQLQDLMVGFRVGMTDSLVALGHTPMNTELAYARPDGGPPPTMFCNDPATYDSLAHDMCVVTDITADPSAPPTATCDAISVGLLFQARQAQLGGIADPPPGLPRCATGVDPATDTCAMFRDL